MLNDGTKAHFRVSNLKQPNIVNNSKILTKNHFKITNLQNSNIEYNFDLVLFSFFYY